MDKITERLKSYIDVHRLDLGEGDCETILDQLYQAYAESHESDPPEIRDSFKELDELLGALPLDDNNAVFNLCCSVRARQKSPIKGQLNQPISAQ